MEISSIEPAGELAAQRARPWRVRLWAWSMIVRRAVVLDTETASLAGGICEIAVADLRGRVLFTTLVNPRRPLEAAAIQVHGLHEADLEDAPPLTDVVRRLSVVVRRRPVLAYNAPFDFSVLSRDAQSLGIDLGGLARWRRWSCVMRARAMATGAAWQPLGASHRAAGDAQAAARVVRELARLQTH